MTNGFLRVAAAVPKVRVADTTANTQEIENLMVAADGKKIDILCFPDSASRPIRCQRPLLSTIVARRGGTRADEDTRTEP